MKPVKVYVSDYITVDSAVEYLQSHIPDDVRNSREYSFVFPEIQSCIEEFSQKAKKLAKAGTTIHINKEFTVAGSKILVILEYPRKEGLFESIAGIFKRP